METIDIHRNRNSDTSLPRLRSLGSKDIDGNPGKQVNLVIIQYYGRFISNIPDSTWRDQDVLVLGLCLRSYGLRPELYCTVYLYEGMGIYLDNHRFMHALPPPTAAS